MFHYVSILLIHVNTVHALTSIEIGMRLIGSQEHGLTRIQDHKIQEVDRKAANVARILRVETEQQVTDAARRVLSRCTCMDQTSVKLDCV